MIARIVFAFVFVFTFASCCPKITPVSTQTTKTVTVDTAFQAGKVAVPEVETGEVLNLTEICDSIMKMRSHDVIIVEQKTKRGADNNHRPKITSVITKDSTGQTNLSLVISSYQLQIDSLQRLITILDSTSTTIIQTTSKCDSRWHNFAVIFFWFVMSVSVVVFVLKILLKK